MGCSNQQVTRLDAERHMADLNARRVKCEIPFADISAYRQSNTGIDYGYSFDSGSSGPHVVITGLSHGNEPGGRAAITRLLDEGIRPRIGKLSLILLNIDAYHASNGVDPYGTRFIDHDFNRVWDDDLLNSDQVSVEIARARAVRPIIADADVLLDIHATPYESAPFFVQKPGSRGIDLAERIDMPRNRLFFEQGSAHQPTIANYAQFGRTGGTAMAATVETGLFFSRQSADVALSSAARLLKSYDMIDQNMADSLIVWTHDQPERHIRVLYPEIVHTADIALLFEPASYRPYRKGEVVAFDGEAPILAPFNGAIPLWIKQKFEENVQAFMWAEKIT